MKREYGERVQAHADGALVKVMVPNHACSTTLEEGSSIHCCARRIGTPDPTCFHTAENDATGCCFWRSFSTACREVVMLQSCDVAVGVIRPERL